MRQPVDDDVHQHLEVKRYHEAFERLVALYSKKVFHLAFSMVRNETQAEDLTQDVFVKVWKALPGYHGTASLSTWLYTIARNTCLTELKKRAARPTVSLQEPDAEKTLESLPELQSRDRENGLEMDVNHLLEQLPAKYRQVLTLFYLEQRAYEEVSALLGMPLGTVKTFLYRAKKEMLKLSTRALPDVSKPTLGTAPFGSASSMSSDNKGCKRSGAARFSPIPQPIHLKHIAL